MAGAFTALAVVLFAVPAWGRGTFGLGMVQGGNDALVSSRFSVVPVMLLASAFAILLSPGVAHRRLATRIGRPIFAAQVAVLLVVCFSLATDRGTDPSWTSRVDRVVGQQCSGQPGSAVVKVPNFIARVPPFPKLPNGYYPVTVRCSNLK